MREVPVEKLIEIPALPGHVLHESGLILFRKGDSLSSAALDKLRERGVESVFFLEAKEAIDTARRDLTHAPLKLDELVAGDPLARSVYDERGQLLLEAGATIPKTFATSLKRRGIAEIYYRKSADALHANAGRALQSEITELGKSGGGSPPAASLKDIEAIKCEVADKALFDVKTLTAHIDSQKSFDVPPEGDAFSDQIRDTKKNGPASEQDKTELQNLVGDVAKTLTRVFEELGNGNGRLDLQAVDYIVSKSISGLIQHRELLVLLGASRPDSGASYLVRHSLAVTILSVSIGTTIGFGARQIKSLGYGALLADVGMVKIPEKILLKEDPLTPREMAEIKMHPSYGLDILEKWHQLPMEVPYVVYQSHERANGSGYPCGKRDVVIHPFARIVSMADIYASVCAERPYRKAKIPYEGMEAVLVACGKQQLNTNTARSFLACNAMFPVGSFVQLSDQRIGRVVYANQESYMRPVVAILRDRHGGDVSAAQERFDLLAHPDFQVTKALSVEDVGVADEVLIGF